MRDLDPSNVAATWRKTLDIAYTIVNVPTGYGILMVLISLSLLDLGSTNVLMDKIDAYCG